jgi:predicted transcriptional regulator
MKQRQEKLQQNAVINQAKSEAEKGVGSVIGNTIVYTNENGNAATLDLTKYDKIASLPTTNKYNTAVRESKQYAEASKIIDNDELSDEQKQIALNRLGISQPDATYYAVANDNNNLKTLYSLDKINDIMNANGSKQQVLDYLTEGRKEINGKMVVANGVLDNLVDEGVITKAEASAIKQIKLDSKGKKISLSKAKKPKKITFKAPKVLKLKAPKITQIKIKSPKIKRVKAYKRPKIRKLKVKRIKLKKFKA